MNQTLFTDHNVVKYPKGHHRLFGASACIVLALLGSLVRFEAIAQDTLPQVSAFQYLNENTAAAFPWTEVQGMDCSMASIGDVDGNGSTDLAVGYPAMDGGRGRVGVLLFGAEYAVEGFTWIGDQLGGNGPQLDSLDGFGTAVVGIGDLNGNGVPDLATLSPGDDASGADQGAIHVIFLNALGEADSTALIATGIGGFTGSSVGGGNLRSLAAIPDVNSDGRTDLLLGAPKSNIGGTARGALYMLLLNGNGTVAIERTYSANSNWPGPSPMTTDSLFFGTAATGLGDIDGDGIGDMAVTAPGGDMIITLLLNDNGTIKGWSEQDPTTPVGITRSTGTESLIGLGNDIDKDGVNELFVTDHQLEVDTKEVGGLLYWDVTAPPGVEALPITYGYAADGNLLGLEEGSRFGNAFTFLGDADENGLPELMVSMAGDYPNIKPAFLIVHLQPAPIEILLTIKDQTPDSLGSVTLKTIGGIPPYRIEWSPELFDLDAFDSLAMEVDTTGLWSMGLRPPFATEITAAELATMVETHLDDVEAGLYWVGVEDSLKTQEETEFAVGLELHTLVEEGANTSEDKKEVEKSGADGWTNMQLKTKNILPKKEDGWLRFRNASDSQTLAVGFKDIDKVSSSGYQHLDQAFFFEDGNYRYWNGESLVGTPKPYSTESVFQIERVSDDVRFLVDDKLVHTIKLAHSASALTISVSIYSEGAKVTDITTNFRSTFSIATSTTHSAPLSPASGAIELDLPKALGPYEYYWLGTLGNDSIATDLDPGEYGVTVSSAHFDHTAYRTYRVGHEILWQDPIFTFTRTGVGSTLTDPDLENPAWQRSCTSLNMVRQGAGHHIAFRPYPLDEENYGSVLGVRSSSDDIIWAGWWTFSFGQSHIAQTISRSGVVKRVLVDEKDELEIVLHTYSIHFLKNGELVHTVSRQSEAESHLFAALHSSESVIRDLVTSLPVPLVLNTEELGEEEPHTWCTPGGRMTGMDVGDRKVLELDGELGTGPYRIVDTASLPGTRGLYFQLAEGTPTDLVYHDGTVGLPLGVGTYHFKEPNELILFNGPGTAGHTEEAAISTSLTEASLMTPNGDGESDALGFTDKRTDTPIDFTVLDRTGATLFQTSPGMTQWNGKFMNSGSLVARGTYIYRFTTEEGTFEGKIQIDY